jgi:hypothetical protein
LGRHERVPDSGRADERQHTGLNTDTLYLVPNSTANATTSLVSTGPHRDVTAMALTVPEPAALAAVGLGGFAVVWRLCARRARFRRS